MRADRHIKPFLVRCAILALLAVKGPTAHAGPDLLLKPPELTNLSAFERSVFEVFLTESLRSSDTFELVLETSREASLEQIGEDLASGSEPDGAAELAAARYIALASAGKSSGSYFLTLKLLDAYTGETIATATERYPTLPHLLENSTELIHSILTRHEPVQSASSPTMTEKASLDFSRKIAGVSQKRFVQWVKTSLRMDADTKKPTVELADVLDQYIAERMPPGLSIYYGGYGVTPIEYSSTRVYTDHTEIDYTSGISAGFASGLHYRFDRFPYLATGLWVSLGSHLIRYSIETYEDGVLESTGRINYDARMDLSAVPFVEIPIRLDSIAFLAGAGWYMADYHSGLEASLGLRAGRLVFRYGLRLRQTAPETWPGCLSVMYTSALGER
jgi:hypothetical protein